jgi:hypothetical protein
LLRRRGVEEDARAVAADDGAWTEPPAGVVVEVVRAKALAQAVAVLFVVEVDLDAPVLSAHGKDDMRPCA